MKNRTTNIDSQEVLLPIYGILVATKDRPQQLDKFLKSVSNLSLLPIEVVIASSGIDITEIIKKYTDKLNLKHVHSLRSGQVIQKKLGLKYVSASSMACTHYRKTIAKLVAYLGTTPRLRPLLKRRMTDYST